jgi:hypothetical protein
LPSKYHAKGPGLGKTVNFSVFLGPGPLALCMEKLKSFQFFLVSTFDVVHGKTEKFSVFPCVTPASVMALWTKDYRSLDAKDERLVSLKKRRT